MAFYFLFRYIRDLILNPPPYQVASAIQGDHVFFKNSDDQVVQVLRD